MLWRSSAEETGSVHLQLELEGQLSMKLVKDGEVAFKTTQKNRFKRKNKRSTDLLKCCGLSVKLNLLRRH